MRGLTLIELLAIIVILAMVSSVLAIGLGSASSVASIQSFASQWAGMDGRARLMSRTQDLDADPIIMVASEGRVALLRHRVDGHDEAVVDEIHSPRGVALRIEGIEHQWIDFDRRGCTPDYKLVLKLHDVKRVWRVHGLTGWIEEIGEGGTQ